jgi:hypothetical protein
MAYKKFRVKTPVKSFRDLEVYQEATKLSALVFNLKTPKGYKNKNIENELTILRDNSKLIPKLIVESYNDKFSDIKVSSKKLEIVVQASNMLVAKLDFLGALTEDKEWRDNLLEILKRYQRLKMRTLNLKRAWEKVFSGRRFR